MKFSTRPRRFRWLAAPGVALIAATSLALTTPPTVLAQQSPPAAQSAEDVQNAPPPERTDTTLRAAPMPVDAMPLEEPPARASAMTRQAPGTALSQEQWNRRPVAQRGQTPKLEQEWKATDNPNREVVPGEMRSDREGIPAGFTKADADRAETMEAALTGSDGAMRAMAAPGCQVYWPAPYEVCGAIRDKYNALGGPNSFLLFPKTNELTNPDGIGKRTEFLNGPIYWSPQGGAHPVVNHFLAAWARHGYENSYIGYPTTDEIVNPDGIGRRQHFTGSTIYWFTNEAYSVGGAIADKWHRLGAEQGVLGYPTSDELVLPDGVGRMNRFHNGVIYWHPTTGARMVRGDILEQWSLAGYELSTYGYPTADESEVDANWFTQNFQGAQLSGEVRTITTLVMDFLEFSSDEEAWEYFDSQEGQAASTYGDAERASPYAQTVIRKGPCRLYVESVRWRTKSGPGGVVGFKPQTVCSTAVESLENWSWLQYLHWGRWATAMTANARNFRSSSMEQKNVSFQCNGEVSTLFGGLIRSKIVYQGTSYYAHFRPDTAKLNCRV